MGFIPSEVRDLRATMCHFCIAGRPAEYTVPIAGVPTQMCQSCIAEYAVLVAEMVA